MIESSFQLRDGHVSVYASDSSVIITASRTGSDAERISSSLLLNPEKARELHAQLGDALAEQDAIATAKAAVKAQRAA